MGRPRYVREIRETLDQLILLGQGHLGHALAAIQRHHNDQRPHQGIGNVIPVGFGYPDEPVPQDEIQCESALGGLLNHYSLSKPPDRLELDNCGRGQRMADGSITRGARLCPNAWPNSVLKVFPQANLSPEPWTVATVFERYCQPLFRLG
jgi:hypothetical protein